MEIFNEEEWTRVRDQKPESGKVVETVIWDKYYGERNRSKLFNLDGVLWFVPNGETYVYYTPTHWREIE